MSGERPSLHMTVKMLARTLSTPVKAGTFITVLDIRRIASELGVPVAVREDRRRIIEEFLLASIDYGRFVEALERVRGLIVERRRRLEELTGLYRGSRGLVEEYLEACEEALRAIDEAVDLYRRFYSREQR